MPSVRLSFFPDPLTRRTVSSQLSGPGKPLIDLYISEDSAVGRQAGQMRAISFDRSGPPSVRQVKEVGNPEPEAGEVVVRVEAIGVNYTDIVLCSGDLGPLTAPEYFDGQPDLPEIRS